MTTPGAPRPSLENLGVVAYGDNVYQELSISFWDPDVTVGDHGVDPEEVDLAEEGEEADAEGVMDGATKLELLVGCFRIGLGVAE